MEAVKDKVTNAEDESSPKFFTSPESLVPRAGDDALSVGRHGEVEHAVAVPSQLGNLDRKDISLQKIC